MKEKLQEFALIAEIISALAVVAGLIFVGLEIRQSTEQAELNTRAIETAAYQDLIGQILQISNTVATDEELFDVFLRNQGGEVFTEQADIARFGLYAISVARHADMACFQFEQGAISEDRLVSAMAIFINVVWPSENGRRGLANVMNSSPGLESCIELVLPYFDESSTYLIQ